MARPDPRPVTPPSGAPPADPPPLADPPPVSPPPVTPPPRPLPTAPGRPILDEGHQLPVHQGKVSRVTGHVKGAATSLTDWIELRIALLKQEVKDEVEAKKRQAEGLGKAYGAAAVLGLVTALVALFMFGFLLSALWGLLLGEEHELWSLTLGFLTMMLIFGGGTVIALNRAEQKKRELTSADNTAPSPTDLPNR